MIIKATLTILLAVVPLVIAWRNVNVCNLYATLVKILEHHAPATSYCSAEVPVAAVTTTGIGSTTTRTSKATTSVTYGLRMLSLSRYY